MTDPADDENQIHLWAQEGHSHLADGNVDAARDAHAKLQDNAPEHRDTLLLSALLAAVDNDLPRSKTILESALDLYPDDLSIRLSGAQLLLEVHMDPNGAIPLLEDVLMSLASARPADPSAKDELELDVRLQLTEAFAQAGDFESAIDAADFAFDRTGDERARFALARARYAFGDVDAAAADLAPALEALGDNAEVWHLEGRLGLSLGDDARAQRAFEKAQELSPEDYPIPPRLSAAEFKQQIERGFALLPEPLRTYVSEVNVQHQIMPSLDELRNVNPPLPPSAPLFLVGERKGDNPLDSLPDTLIVFQRNIEVLSGSVDEINDVMLTALIQAYTLFMDPDGSGTQLTQLFDMDDFEPEGEA